MVAKDLQSRTLIRWINNLGDFRKKCIVSVQTFYHQISSTEEVILPPIFGDVH